MGFPVPPGAAFPAFLLDAAGSPTPVRADAVWWRPWRGRLGSNQAAVLHEPVRQVFLMPWSRTWSTYASTAARWASSASWPSRRPKLSLAALVVDPSGT